MSDDQIRTIHDKLDRIERAISGEPALGHRGLAQRLGDAEAKIDGHDRKLILWGGVVTGISLVLGYVKSTFLK